MIGKRSTSGWLTLLADLSLILFIVSASSIERDGSGATGSPPADRAVIAPDDASQALAVWRAGPQAPPVSEWLTSQQRDARASVLIVAEYSDAGRDAAWLKARAVAQQIEAGGHKTQISIRPGDDGNVSASLHYAGLQDDGGQAR